MQISTMRKQAAVAAVLLLTLLAVVSLLSLSLHRRTVAADERLQRLNLLAAEMRQSSNELTALARDYVTTGEPKFRELYFTVLDIRSGKRPRPENWAPSDWRSGRELEGGQPRALLQLLIDEGVPEETFALLAKAQAESELLAKLEISLMDQVGQLPAEGRFETSDRADLIARMHDESYHDSKRVIMAAASDFESAVRLEASEKVAALHREQRMHLIVSFVIVGLMLAGIVPLMIYVNSAVLMPLSALSAAAERMSKGDYTARAEVTATNEIGRLSIVFNQMASSIASEMEKVGELRFALDNVPVYVYMKDRESRYTYANKLTLELFGCSAEELTGRGDVDFFPPAAVERLRQIDLRVLDGESTHEEIVVGDDNERIYLEVKTPLREDESVIGLLGISTDVTETRHAEERWRALLQGSADAIILTDANGYIQVVNERTEALFGYASGDLVGRNVDILLPEHLRKRHANYRNEFDWSTGERPMFERRNLVGMHRDGRTLRLDLGLSRVESHGTRWNMAIVHDLTGHYEMSERVRLLSAALEQADNGIVITNRQGVCHWVNPGFERITGYSKDEVVGRRMSILKSGVHSDAFFRDLWETVNAGRTWHGEIHNRNKAGEIYVEEQRISPVQDDEGRITHFVAVKQNVTDRIEMEKQLLGANQAMIEQLAEIETLQAKLREQAIRDELTGLYNRRYLSDALERELSRSRREKHPVAIAVIDLDHFKSINDTWGHSAGDEALRSVAELLRSKTRLIDTICRFGGEEFIVIMPGADLEDAKRKVDALRESCEDTFVEWEASRIRVTFSAGVSVFPEHGADGDTLVTAADKALYRAKSEGRNRVVGFQEVVTVEN